MSSSTEDLIVFGTPEAQKNISDVLTLELTTQIKNKFTSPISDERIKLLDSFSQQEMANYQDFHFEVYAKLFGIAVVCLPVELVSILSPILLSLLKNFEDSSRPGFTKKFVDSAMNDPDVLDFLNGVKTPKSGVDSITVLNGGTQSGGDDNQQLALTTQSKTKLTLEEVRTLLTNVSAAVENGTASQDNQLVAKSEAVLKTSQANLVTTENNIKQKTWHIKEKVLTDVADSIQTTPWYDLGLESIAISGGLMATAAIVITIIESALGAGLVVGVGFILLIFTMIRKGGLAGIITGSIGAVVSTGTVLAKTVGQNAWNMFRTQEQINKQTAEAAEANRAANKQAIIDAAQNTFELLAQAFVSTREGLIEVRGSIMGWQDAIPKEQRISFGLCIFVALIIGVYKLLKEWDRKRAVKESLEFLKVVNNTEQKGGSLNRVRRLPSLPTRRVRRFSSSKKGKSTGKSRKPLFKY